MSTFENLLCLCPLSEITQKSKEEAWESDSDEDSDDDGEPLTLEEQAAVRALIEAAARVCSSSCSWIIDFT